MGAGHCDRGRVLATLVKGACWGCTPRRPWGRLVPGNWHLAVAESAWAFILALHVCYRHLTGFPAAIRSPVGSRPRAVGPPLIDAGERRGSALKWAVSPSRTEN